MDAALLGLWYVCGLGTAVFGATAPAGWRSVVPFGVAAGAAAWWATPGRLPAVSVVGLVAAAGALFQLLRGCSPRLSAVLAGSLAGVWTAVLEVQGVPAWMSPGLALAVPVIAAACATRRAFAPESLRDEALLFVAVLGAVAAAVPVVHEGWRAAIALKLQDAAPAAAAVPAWTIVLSIMAAAAGGVYSLWSRR